MTRRATYMYGTLLPRGPLDQVGCGLGQAPSTGEVAIIVPTIDIRETGEKHTIDGVEIEFQMAPGTEAPAEMHFYFPRFRALCMAENATHNLHNLLTLRGALVRDPHAWSGYLTEAIDTFADRADVVFASHHWPTWGRESIVDFLSLQRDMYAYLHDQTLRLLNQGYTGVEIAEMFQMPPALERAWHTRGYYGSVSHNVKAVYQRYMGWFDGNPARLWPHPPEALAPRYVEAMGGIDRVVDLAKAAFDAGDFRWAATLLDHAIFTDSGHGAARALYADTLEQLAYGAENATWRNFFLSGATELRDGNFGTAAQVASPTMLSQLTPEQIFDSLAIRVDGPRSWDLDIAIDITFADLAANYRLTLRNGVLVYRRLAADSTTATVTVKLDSKFRLLAAAMGDFSSPGLEISGDQSALQALLGCARPARPEFQHRHAVASPRGGRGATRQSAVTSAEWQPPCPSTLRSRHMPQCGRGFGQGEPRADVRPNRPGGEHLRQLLHVTRGVVGPVAHEGADLHAADGDSLEQHEIERNGRDRARGVAEGDESSAAGQTAQRRLRIRSADGVEDHPGGVAGELTDARLQVFPVVIDGRLRTALPAQLELFGTRRRRQHPGLHGDRQIDGRQAHTAGGAQHDHPFPLPDCGDRSQRVVCGAVGDAECRGRGEVDTVGDERHRSRSRAALARRTPRSRWSRRPAGPDETVRRRRPPPLRRPARCPG